MRPTARTCSVGATPPGMRTRIMNASRWACAHTPWVLRAKRSSGVSHPSPSAARRSRSTGRPARFAAGMSGPGTPSTVGTGCVALVSPASRFTHSGAEPAVRTRRGWSVDPCHVGKARERLEERQPAHPGGPVPVLRHDDLGLAPVGRVVVVHVVAVDEHDDVGVLLDRPGLAEVGQHGALVGPQLELAGELAEGDDGTLELAGEDLEATADLGHLDLAVLGRPTTAHQLEVVDDDHAEVADLALEPAGLGPDLHDGDLGVVVDPDRRLGEAADRPADAAPVVLGQAAGTDLGGVDAGLAAQEALAELEAAHLEAEQQHRSVRMQR